jgi:SAM-dependent methyltransferase
MHETQHVGDSDVSFMNNIGLKQSVKRYWEAEVCGSRYGRDLSADRKAFFHEIDEARYKLEPMLVDFAGFSESNGKRVLEVGLGTGADFVRWLQAGATGYGRDLTQGSVDLVKERMQLAGLEADVGLGDAENLAEFGDSFFDVYYSWGVLHHTPNIERAIGEAYRVLKPGGTLKLMLYHYPSVTSFLVWTLRGPLRFNFRGPRTCFTENVESPGTKAFTRREARVLIGKFFGTSPIDIRTYLGPGDLLIHRFSPKYQGKKWELAKSLYPRWFVRHVLGHRFGMVMTIAVRK